MAWKQAKQHLFLNIPNKEDSFLSGGTKFEDGVAWLIAIGKVVNILTNEDLLLLLRDQLKCTVGVTWGLRLVTTGKVVLFIVIIGGEAVCAGREASFTVAVAMCGETLSFSVANQILLLT